VVLEVYCAAVFGERALFASPAQHPHRWPAWSPTVASEATNPEYSGLGAHHRDILGALCAQRDRPPPDQARSLPDHWSPTASASVSPASTIHRTAQRHEPEPSTPAATHPHARPTTYRQALQITTGDDVYPSLTKYLSLDVIRASVLRSNELSRHFRVSRSGASPT
jgi:hypothetical protein